ncbi:heterogeneous nuclear ribonucleoprotein D-like [Papaver somniferum]|uniref:heterogeneous nuclear ribonucleoprotein D-like n=1 Tax=Papaver somniferum TaxID=3469 RepID=UPI000E703B8B|nr:heterogeneous nuclear ribonucleoprotein D-like [Papaver somniferum]
MEESVSRALMESDFVETKVLEALIGAFSSTFSLREIASAYCKAGCNPDMAAQILYDGAEKLNKNYSNAALVVSTTQCETSCISSSASCEGVAHKTNCADNRNSMASKATKMAVSIGCASGVIGFKGFKTGKPALSAGSASGEGYVMRNTPADGPVSTNEPLEWDMKDLPIDELIDEDVSSDSTAKEDQMHTEPGKIFVGGMSWDTDEATLKDHFNKFGEVVETNILIDRTTGCSRGFGFVRFSDKSVADKVLLEKHVILGKKVDVGKVVLKHNNPCDRKGFNKSNGNNGQFRTKKFL